MYLVVLGFTGFYWVLPGFVLEIEIPTVDFQNGTPRMMGLETNQRIDRYLGSFPCVRVSCFICFVFCFFSFFFDPFRFFSTPFSARPAAPEMKTNDTHNFYVSFFSSTPEKKEIVSFFKNTLVL